MDFFRGRRVIFYIFKELLPPFLVGVFVFLSLIIIFQSFRITDYIIKHGGSFKAIALTITYLAISIIPITLPISLLFATLTTFGRLSSQGEIGAFRNLGLEFKHIAVAPFLLSIIVAISSLFFSFTLAPIGAQKMISITNYVKDIKPTSIIKEGVFTKNFENLIFFVNKIDQKTQVMKDIFIYDQRNPKAPLTIIAEKGNIIDSTSKNKQQTFLRLKNGNIHKLNPKSYTKIDFLSYDINFLYQFESKLDQMPIYGMTSKQLLKNMNDPSIPINDKTHFKIEYNKRLAIAFACLIFSILSVSLVIKSKSERNRKTNDIFIGLLLTSAFWGLMVLAETLALRLPSLSVLVTWAPNIIFLFFTFYQVKRGLKV